MKALFFATKVAAFAALVLFPSFSYAAFLDSLTITTTATYLSEEVPSSTNNSFSIKLLQSKPTADGLRDCTVSGEPADGAVNVGNCQWTEFVDNEFRLLLFTFNYQDEGDVGTSAVWGEYCLLNEFGGGKWVRFFTPDGTAQRVVGAASGDISIHPNTKEPIPACEDWTDSRVTSSGQRDSSPISTEYVRECLAMGADPNARNEHDETMLHHVAWARGDNVTAVRLLLNAGADPNVRSTSNVTPLHLAASWQDNLAIVITLLKAEANPNAMDDNGYTPLYYHNYYGLNPEIERVLVKAGADPNLVPGIECSTQECADALT